MYISTYICIQLWHIGNIENIPLAHQRGAVNYFETKNPIYGGLILKR